MPEPPDQRVRVFGVRHHGPGSATSLVAGLDAWRPETVLIEGPPEADALVGWVAHQGLQPPVALLAYVSTKPSTAAFWPMAVFSPEWQALRWAVDHGAEVRFMDLPAAVSLAGHDSADDGLFDDANDADHDPDPSLRTDPIAVLARTAGYTDPERWWDDVIEHRVHQGEGADPFDAITEAMGELRAAAVRVRGSTDEREETRREAHMRQVLRGALRDTSGRIAVVCGAWHAPVLVPPLPPATHDQRALRGLKKQKVTLTWVPWTHSRLSYESGYGAGIDSPGWYHHLFTAPDAVIERWLTHVAGVLRRHDLPVSSAHVIEAVRLAETLATLRERPLAGLDEVQEATLAVMCDGNPLALEFVTRAAVVGERLGRVPDEAPTLPLEADLRATARSVRLAFAADAKQYTLDLRRDIDRGKSRLLRRLAVLGIAWGREEAAYGTGTFKEIWTTQWRPEFAVNVVEASLWGTTVAAAATNRLLEPVDRLADVTARVEQALLADLPDALPELVQALDAKAAHEADVAQLMEALPALIRARRYGDVRNTDTSALADVAEAMLRRVCAGLGAAVAGLDDEAAEAMRRHIEAVQSVVGLLPDAQTAAQWLSTLGAVAARGDVAPIIVGRVVRLLLDAERVSREEAVTRLRQALSHGSTPTVKAAWAEGFLAGSATLLIHDDLVLGVLDSWVGDLAGDDFTVALPMLRRALGAFNAAERRAIAERVQRLGGSAAPAHDTPLDTSAAENALATVRALLGVGT